jgi:Icc-related predicted phosphoesterase
MKIGYFSDLHTEFMRPDIMVEKNRHKSRYDQHTVGIETFGQMLAEAYAAADIVVAAGDIATNGNAITFLQDAFKDKPVIFVPGNHDYWGGEYYALNRKMRDAAEGSNVHFFYDGGTIEIDGVLFVAATLWTDFAVLDNLESCLKNGSFLMNDYPNIAIQDRRAYKVREAMYEARDTMNDYRKIRLRRNGSKMMDAPRDALGILKLEVPRRLIPQDVLGFHKTALAKIERVMQEAYATYKKLVVVTHHAPSLRSLKEGLEGEYFPQKSDPFYASELSHLLKADAAPVLWIHGHTHLATLHEVGNTVVVSNPKGYGNGDDTGFELIKVAEI